MHFQSCRILGAGLSLVLVACGGGVSSEEGARAAYLGLDLAVEKAMNLGFDGFNAATSANIPPQMTTGDESGTMTISGQVDQGASANKGMRLRVELVEYSDETDEEELAITYDTPDAAALPALTLQLRDIPDGTLSGSLVGTFRMTGEIEGDVTLNLTFAGEIEPHPDGGVRRVVGSTTVTGTATSSYGTYQVDLTI
jgi:hypothetical protein